MNIKREDYNGNLGEGTELKTSASFAQFKYVTRFILDFGTVMPIFDTPPNPAGT